MSGGSKNQTVTNRVDIPSFLQPFLQTGANVGNQALQGLQTQLSNGMPVAPLNEVQMQAGRNIVGSGNQGADYLMGFSGGAGRFVDSQLPGFTGALKKATEDSFIDPVTTNQLRQFAQQGIGAFSMNPYAMSALQGAASGDHLYGTPAFDEAVQASIRAANPGILSAFGAGGAGAIKGGLAQAARQQAASDAFSRLYAQERANQLGAASTLGNIGLGARGQDISDRGLQINAATNLGNLGIQQQALRNQALGIQANALDAERARQLQSGLFSTQMRNQTAQNQLTLGDRLQQQNQAEMLSGIAGNQALFGAAQGMGLNSLLGQSSTQPYNRSVGAGLIGGALNGAQLGSLFAKEGATGLGLIGGPLGLGLTIGGGLLGGFL